MCKETGYWKEEEEDIDLYFRLCTQGAQKKLSYVFIFHFQGICVIA